MTRLLSPKIWPLTLKVPLLAAGLMVAVAAVVSHVILQRLTEDQEGNLRQLTGSYLDGLSTALLPYVIRQDVWETFDILDRARDRYSGVNARYTVVAIDAGTVLAASDPARFPVGKPLPAELAARIGTGRELTIDEDQGVAWIHRDLRQENIDLGSIFAEVDISNLLAVRREVLMTLILANGGLTLFFAVLGYAAVRRMVRPISLLTAHVDRLRHGDVVPIPDSHLSDQGTEFGRLFASFNAMAVALGEREALASRLAEEEKVAQLGKLASGMAHEVNNPLGGMLNLVDTLRKHGHDAGVRQRSLDLLERGLVGVQNVVRATLAIYKGDPVPAALERRELDDLQFLVQHESERRRIELRWQNDLPESIEIDGAAVRQIALNLLLNAFAASPAGAAVELSATAAGGDLALTIRDQGAGLPASVSDFYRQPMLSGHAPRDGIGLGVWTICLLVSRLGGRIDAHSTSQGGTRIVVSLPIGREVELDAVA